MIITFVGNFDVSYTSETHHANTLESLGHTVIRLREGKTTGGEILKYAEQSELLIWVHTHGWETPGLSPAEIFRILKEKNIPTATYHLDLWLGISRQKDLDNDPFYRNIGHFFTCDKLMANWFNENTEVKGHYLQAGVYEPECYMAEPNLEPRNPGMKPERKHDVIFVGSRGYHPEWPYRPRLIDWLSGYMRNGFLHVGNDGIGVKRGAELNQLYADSNIAIGDSLCINYDYPYYWSDRVYETLGRGGFMIHPYITGMEMHFEDGKHLVFYKFNDFEDLKRKIDFYLENDELREEIRLAGHNHVKEFHTYTNRWRTILHELGLE